MAQITQTTETVDADKSFISRTQLKGELRDVAHDSIVVKMIPDGDYRVFVTTPDRIILVDGVEKRVDELEVGTILTAEVTVTQTSALERTTAELTGTVFLVGRKSVVLTLENGQNKQYQIKPDFEVMVNGEPMLATDLKKGMVVKAVKIVEEPVVELVTDSVVTGVAPD